MNDPAARRFFALGAIRLSGVVLAFAGISIVAKRWIEPADVLGTILIALGAFAVLVLPVLLARRWRSR
ncbi:MAG: hypothetical protein H0X36_06625 [Sphingomonadaceae bacterium]|nr:hypothetical protein [Sphingomonadaceae bacterium]